MAGNGNILMYRTYGAKRDNIINLLQKYSSYGAKKKIPNKQFDKHDVNMIISMNNLF